MGDFLYYVFNRSPGAFTVIFYILTIGLAVFFTLVAGSIRWWHIRRTRLPQMWARERKAYENEIATLESQISKLQEENDRLQTAAYGQVVTVFRTSVKAARQ